MHWVDPDFLPATRGTLARFLLNPKADIDGLLLTDGTEVHTPPHLSAALLKALKPGSALTVRGLKPRDVDMLVALAIDPEGGKRILDEGPHGPHAKPKPKPKPPGKPPKPEVAQHSGTITRLLHGPHGQVHGVLLDDAVTVRFAPHAGADFAKQLVVGKPLVAEGTTKATPHGVLIHAHALGSKAATLKQIAHPPHGPAHKPKPKPKPKH
ncbi:hypothetical protein [Xanthomonas nasturtii]|uniref:DUF5666 domain-containing protein n=1 Tax=Xanthomonas nasturtii TaxID=1843581 RepID=A0ABT0LSI1_9XANT|nr:hypothetical protein [Xanthomonas nasturtii]MCL1552298.1 hypothetical protein [Xanthomonas nasturtii]MCL1556543.1 hypothetical protein [Xanthomonas nasturtii]MCL1557997.1 hypothetical protein [Xanthomonas nasturtii]